MNTEGKKRGRINCRPAVLILIALLMLTAPSLAGCGSDGQTADHGGAGADETAESGLFPVTVTDDLGNQVTIRREPERIVSLSPANTEILFALGLSGKVAGRTDYCNYPADAAEVPSVGDFNAPNLEKIIAMAPDLVMATDFIQDDIRAQLESAGAAVIVYNAAGIEGVEEDIRKTGSITGTPEQAEALIWAMEEKRAAVSAKVKAALKEAAPEGERSVFIDIGNFYSAGEGSLLGSLLSELGLKNIAADTGMQWPQLPAESIIAADPDVYVSFYTRPEEIRKLPGFDTVDAVKNNRIVYYEMLSPESDLVQRPGPRIADGLEQLAKDIVPEAFQ